MNPQKFNPEEALKLLELPLDSFKSIKDAKTLENFKDKIRKQRKILAKKYHPDRFANQETMNEINAVCDLLLDLRIKMPQQRTRIIIRSYVYSSSSTTSTTGGYYGY